MAKKKDTGAKPAAGRPLQIEDLEQIVGGAATHQQYDDNKQDILANINNDTISKAVADAAANAVANPSQITTAITNIENLAQANHVSEVAALAALEAATYGNAKVNGSDAVAAELTKLLTNGAGEADMAHLAAQGFAKPDVLVSELNQAVNVLAMGSADGHTALGLQTNAAVDWVEAKLEVAGGKEAAADATAGFNQVHDLASLFSVMQQDAKMVQAATALQSFLDVQHQGEVAEGKGIESVFTALGSHLGTIQQDAAALQGLSGSALQAAITAAEQAGGVPNEVTLAALDLFSHGNAAVQQALSAEYKSGAIETNLAQAVATGAITADQAVQTLNLVIADLAQNSVNSSTTPALEQGFAIAAADVALANAAAALAASDRSAATAAASGYQPNQTLAASLNQQAALADGLKTLINTTYAGEVAVANELNDIKTALGNNAQTYITEANNLIANPALAQGYINAIEAAGSSSVSVDAALTLLAAYSHNSTVLNEIEKRLVNGTTEANLTQLVTTGAISAAQAVTILTHAVDTLAASSPNNSVTLTGADGHSIVLDRASAVDWAEAQLTKAVVAAQNSLTQNIANLSGQIPWDFLQFNIGKLNQDMSALVLATAQLGFTSQLTNLLETTHGNEVLQGIGIDIGWAAASASADAAAVIAAGTHDVPGAYGIPTPQVDAQAQALANSINQHAQAYVMGDLKLAQSIMELNFKNATASEIGNDKAVMTTVNQMSSTMETVFATGLSFGEAIDPNILDTWAVIKDPSDLSAWETLGVDIATDIAMDAAGVGIIGDIGAADAGMVWLLNQSAVSSVLGSELTGDLKGYYQTCSDLCNGISDIFSDNIKNSMDLVIGGVKEMVEDLGNNAVTMANDLASGNISALPHDLQNLISSFGTDLEDYAKNWVNTGIKDVEDTFNDVKTMFGNMANDLMSSPAISSAVHWVDDQGKAVLAELNSIGIGPSEIADWFKDTAGDALKELEELGNGIANLPNEVLHGIEDLGGTIKDGFVEFGDDIASMY
jgi:hypothetical protein